MKTNAAAEPVRGNPHLLPRDADALPFIAPQPGPQELLLRLRWVDIIVYGGAAGGGKSFGVLLDAAFNAALAPVRGYSAVIFRRTSTQVTQPGGLWETSQLVYPLTTPAGKPRQTPWLGWEWKTHGTSVRFSHLQYEDDKLSWQGAQVDYIGFDELTHFTESQFFYLMSRLRHARAGGIKPIMRATTNPDPDSWVKRFLAPWVDSTYPDPARSGEVRYFYRDGDAVIWLHAPYERPPHISRDAVHSVTFIEARLEDNPALTQSDPGYRGRLMSLPYVERVILLGGPEAWNVRRDGNMFKHHWFPLVDAAPARFRRVVRRWDLAATEPRKGQNDPDWTVGVKMGLGFDDRYYVLDVVFARETPAKIKALIERTAESDGRRVAIRLPQDPGQAGKGQLHDFVSMLDGYDVGGEPETGDKATRAKPLSAQAEVGNVVLVRAAWNEQYLAQLTAFPNAHIHDDAVDASSGAHLYLSRTRKREQVPYASASSRGRDAGDFTQQLADAQRAQELRDAERDAEREELQAAQPGRIPLPDEFDDALGDALIEAQRDSASSASSESPLNPNEQRPDESDDEYLARRRAEAAERFSNLLEFLGQRKRDGHR